MNNAYTNTSESKNLHLYKNHLTLKIILRPKT